MFFSPYRVSVDFLLAMFFHSVCLHYCTSIISL